MIETIGAPELIIIGVVVILLFGAGKLAHLGRGLGDGVREFRRAMHEDAPELADTGTRDGAVIDGPAALEPGARAPIEQGQAQGASPQIF